MIIKESKKAFTLIEVLISVTLLAVAASALLQIASNSKQNFEFTKERVFFDEIVSIPLTHRNKKYHKTSKNLYEYLYREYNLSNDEIIHFLKKKKISYEQKNYSVIKPFESNETNEEENKNQTPSFTINVDQITIFDKKNSFKTFTVYLQ